MSLQVWLPLNGDLHNQGLTNLNIINNNVTFTAEGKIGQCGNFNGNDSHIKFNSVFSNGNQNFTFCCWMKLNSIPSSYYNLVCCRTSDAGTGVSIWLSNAKKFLIDIGTRWTTQTYNFEVDTWYHIAIVSSDINRILYINGVQIETSTIHTAPTTVNTNYTLIGAQHANAAGTASGTYFNGQLNDIRIYNHALSAKEVEEISKGLVLHYKFDKAYTQTTPLSKNLLTGTGFTATDFSNMTVSNSSTDWTKYIRWYNGSKSIHSFTDGIDTITLNDTANLGICFVRKATDINLDSNSYYTLSCEAQTTKAGAQLSLGISYRSTSNAWVWRGGTNKTTFNAINTWQTFSVTFKPDSNTQYICYCFTCSDGESGGTDTVSIRHCQLEKGAPATEWVLSNNDADFKGNDIDDASGYNNSGRLIGSLTTSSSPPRYGLSCHIGATSTKIHIVNFITSGFSDSYSFAWWGKKSAAGPMFWGFSDGIRLNGMYNSNLWNTGDGTENPLYSIGTTTQVTVPSVSSWHHYVMTGDGNKCYVYLDGDLWAEAKTYKSISGTSIYINGWNTSTSYSSNNMDISDFRIYSTALTETQVKELYNTSMSIDNKANIYIREEIEDLTLSINQQGQFVNDTINEINNISAPSLSATKVAKMNNLYEY